MTDLPSCAIKFDHRLALPALNGRQAVIHDVIKILVFQFGEAFSKGPNRIISQATTAHEAINRVNYRAKRRTT